MIRTLRTFRPYPILRATLSYRSALFPRSAGFPSCRHHTFSAACAEFCLIVVFFSAVWTVHFLFPLNAYSMRICFAITLFPTYLPLSLSDIVFAIPLFSVSFWRHPVMFSATSEFSLLFISLYIAIFPPPFPPVCLLLFPP